MNPHSLPTGSGLSCSHSRKGLLHQVNLNTEEDGGGGGHRHRESSLSQHGGQGQRSRSIGRVGKHGKDGPESHMGESYQAESAQVPRGSLPGNGKEEKAMKT